MRISMLQFEMDMVYVMAQAAIDMFSRYLAMELGPKGVRCNTVQ